MRGKSFLASVLILLLLNAQPSWGAESDELTLTVSVIGLSDTDEAVEVKGATVNIEGPGGDATRVTKTSGTAKFSVPRGTVNIIVTGEKTDQHWKTGSCSVEVSEDLFVNFRLDLEQTTHRCERLTMAAEVVAAPDSEAVEEPVAEPVDENFEEPVAEPVDEPLGESVAEPVAENKKSSHNSAD